MIPRLDPSLDHVPVDAFNELVDAVNELQARGIRLMPFGDKHPDDAIDEEADGKQVPHRPG